MEWRQEKDMPVFMYIFLNKIDDAEEARWTEKEKNEGYKTYKKLLELTEDDSSDVIKKCLSTNPPDSRNKMIRNG